MSVCPLSTRSFMGMNQMTGDKVIKAGRTDGRTKGNLIPPFRNKLRRGTIGDPKVMANSKGALKHVLF